MKIVIEIPEDVYKTTVFYREFKDLSDCVTTIKALEKAIPLPEHHGRLIDADAFCKILKQVSDERRYDTLFSDNLLSVADVFNAIISDLNGTSIDGYMNAPTIIEADGGGAE